MKTILEIFTNKLMAKKLSRRIKSAELSLSSERKRKAPYTTHWKKISTQNKMWKKSPNKFSAVPITKMKFKI